MEKNDYQISDLYSVVCDKSPVKHRSEHVVLVPVDGLNRERIVEVLEKINASSPKSVGIDIIFEFRNDDDSALISTITKCNSVLSAIRINDSTLRTSYFCYEHDSLGIGVANLEVNSPFEVVRTYRSQYVVGERDYNSFARGVVAASGIDITNTAESAYIYFPTLVFDTITPTMLDNHPDVCREQMRDRIVLVGDMRSIQDIHNTAIRPMSGLQIQASIIETMIGDQHIRLTSKWIDWLIALISCVLLILFNMIISERDFATGKLLFRLAQLLVLYLFFSVGCWFFSRHNLCIDFAPALSMIALGLLAYDIWFGLVGLCKKIISKYKNTEP